MNDRETRIQIAIERVEHYLDANYPHDCGEDDCPGNNWEAEDLVRMVLESVETNGVDHD